MHLRRNYIMIKKTYSIGCYTKHLRVLRNRIVQKIATKMYEISETCFSPFHHVKHFIKLQLVRPLQTSNNLTKKQGILCGVM